MNAHTCMVLARGLAHIAVVEARIVVCLFRWPLRRRHALDDFPYHGESAVGVFVLAVLFSAPVEALILALLLPWGWLRSAALALEVCSLVWMCGFAASLKLLQHRLDASGVRLYYGALAEVYVPYTLIAEVERERCTAPGGRDGCRFVASENATYFTVGGKTDVVLRLREPISVQRTLTASPATRTLHVAVDEPDHFVTVLRKRAMSHDSSVRLSVQSGV